MNFGNRFPEGENAEQILAYLRELKGSLNGIDKEILRIVRAETAKAVAAHEAEKHSA